MYNFKIKIYTRLGKLRRGPEFLHWNMLDVELREINIFLSRGNYVSKIKDIYFIFWIILFFPDRFCLSANAGIIAEPG